MVYTSLTNFDAIIQNVCIFNVKFTVVFTLRVTLSHDFLIFA